MTRRVALGPFGPLKCIYKAPLFNKNKEQRCLCTFHPI